MQQRGFSRLLAPMLAPLSSSAALVFACLLPPSLSGFCCLLRLDARLSFVLSTLIHSDFRFPQQRHEQRFSAQTSFWILVFMFLVILVFWLLATRHARRALLFAYRLSLIAYR